MNQSLHDALNKLTKWRSLFAGWQLGTRPKGEPECDAVRDHRELSILLRVEMSAMAILLVKKNLITEAEWQAAVKEEAIELDKFYEKRFPGFRSFAHGMEIYDPAKAVETTKGWKP